jgi:hypothetical protein
MGSILKPILHSAAAFLIGVVPAGCGGGKSDHVKKIEQLEDNIRKGIAMQFAVEVKKVDCPRDYDREKSFECDVVADDGVEIEVVVTPTGRKPNDEDREVEWRTKSLVVRLDSMEEHLRQYLAADKKDASDVDCGGKIIVRKPGDTIMCTVTLKNGNTLVANAEIVDDKGTAHFSFK